MSRIVAWTGHRPDLFRDPSAARAAVVATAEELAAHEQAECFLVGGQRGVDTWAAQAALDLSVPLTLVLPLEIAEFANDWTADDRHVLESIAARATELRVIGGEPAAAYTERNRQLACQADLLVAVWTGPILVGGGTAETIAIARAAGTAVREIVLPLAQMAHWPSGRGI